MQKSAMPCRAWDGGNAHLNNRVMGGLPSRLAVHQSLQQVLQHGQLSQHLLGAQAAHAGSPTGGFLLLQHSQEAARTQSEVPST